MGLLRIFTVVRTVAFGIPARCLKEWQLPGGPDNSSRIIVVFQVDGPTFWGALNEAVMPRIAQIATDQATAEDEDGNFMAEVAEAAEVNEEEARDAAEELGDWIQGQNLDNGTEVCLRWSPNGVLRASVNGGEETSYSSNELCQVKRSACGPGIGSP